MSRAEIIDLIEQISRGVEHIHQRNLAHRDLKLQNIVLVKEGDRQLFKLIDFGTVAKTELLEKKNWEHKTTTRAHGDFPHQEFALNHYFRWIKSLDELEAQQALLDHKAVSKAAQEVRKWLYIKKPFKEIIKSLAEYLNESFPGSLDQSPEYYEKSFDEFDQNKDLSSSDWTKPLIIYIRNYDSRMADIYTLGKIINLLDGDSIIREGYSLANYPYNPSFRQYIEGTVMSKNPFARPRVAQLLEAANKPEFLKS